MRYLAKNIFCLIINPYVPNGINYSYYCLFYGFQEAENWINPQYIEYIDSQIHHLKNYSSWKIPNEKIAAYANDSPSYIATIIRWKVNFQELSEFPRTQVPLGGRFYNAIDVEQWLWTRSAEYFNCGWRLKYAGENI